MSKLVQLYSDAAHTEKEYPVTTSAAVLHGEETLNEVITDLAQEVQNPTEITDAASAAYIKVLDTNGESKKIDQSNLADGMMPTGGVYESVDLGLPSGTLWARCNVGATAETDYGDLFAWGATEPYRVGTDSTGNYSSSKANTIQRDLKSSDDAATVHMGTGWCMPTKAQYDELLANTTAEWTSIGGVAGRKFTASNGNYVFFPASGYYYGSSVYRRGSYGHYWSRSFYSSTSAWLLYFYSDSHSTNTNSRYDGFSVRGVRA